MLTLFICVNLFLSVLAIVATNTVSLFNALLLVESVWILLYFICAFLSLFFGTHFWSILLPLVLVFAGLEIVLGFYFLYYV